MSSRRSCPWVEYSLSAAISARRSRPRQSARVGRERRDLKEDEGVERVAGDCDASGPHRQTGTCVEEVVLLRVDLGLDAGAAVGQHHGGNGSHEHQHERTQHIDPVLDAPRRLDGVGDFADLGHLQPQRDGHRRAPTSSPPARQPRRPGCAAARASAVRRAGHDDLQRRQVQGPGSLDTLRAALQG